MLTYGVLKALFHLSLKVPGSTDMVMSAGKFMLHKLYRYLAR